VFQDGPLWRGGMPRGKPWCHRCGVGGRGKAPSGEVRKEVCGDAAQWLSSRAAPGLPMEPLAHQRDTAIGLPVLPCAAGAVACSEC
jgi:hypothetical protein